MPRVAEKEVGVVKRLDSVCDEEIRCSVPEAMRAIAASAARVGKGHELSFSSSRIRSI